MTITGMGEYTGTVTRTFKIQKQTETPISDVTVSGIQDSSPWTGSPVTPDPVLMVNGKRLTKDKDYTVTYSNNVNEGTVTMTITGKGEYKGTVTRTFKIQKDAQKPADQPAQPTKVVMYRLYNPNSGEHFYTANQKEQKYLVSIGWKVEGKGWDAPDKSEKPVYRLYNPNAGDHH